MGGTITLAIKQMTPLKALGLDSISPLFHLHYWNLVDDDINQSVLDTYGKCSGWQINRSKKTIFFSKSTSKEIRDHIKPALGVPEIKKYEKYLGLRSLVGRNKKNQLQLYKGEDMKKKSKDGKKNCYLKQEGKS